ncbi:MULTISPECIES: MucR family transcriptional regulator [unclassified Sphingomonas]|uniref:MucR family transcriptional regulator n=1 Tax=unclassified Sphingomonas TaxID=196159 RepID=UPI0006FB93F1|nr:MULTISPECIES: MucR family transcriptional regulator [unclassified Sphingomonas]KQO07919.1 transcriptional regulator [Sphingomonas sp. Leaf242]KQS49701.1 transcriptional regulator [Sphingomonas sp. Leaf198]RMB24847.1 MucR family transcriptional regulator [Sphingomonas sp. PP-F2F-G114-C0414]RMB54696.1 MucR family transcriptional regulator [Sphingomonas sp. PP-CE-3A-406]TCP65868.1 MucR family transcriptional regulator [Sphingomonas sp. PP-CE-1G-424]
MTDTLNTVELAAELTAAWLANPNTRTAADDVPAFLLAMHAAVAKLVDAGDAEPEAAPVSTAEPAVSARKSLASPDHIISMLDGKKYKTLRRHLSTNGLTPEQYRERFNLKPDYPMVAATYSEARRAMAKSIGLGRKAGSTVEKAAGSAATTVRKTGKAALDAAKKTLGNEG